MQDIFIEKKNNPQNENQNQTLNFPENRRSIFFNDARL